MDENIGPQTIWTDELVTLPMEIYEIILNYIELDVSSLYNLSFVNKFFKRLLSHEKFWQKWQYLRLFDTEIIRTPKILWYIAQKVSTIKYIDISCPPSMELMNDTMLFRMIDTLYHIDLTKWQATSISIDVCAQCSIKDYLIVIVKYVMMMNRQTIETLSLKYHEK